MALCMEETFVGSEIWYRNSVMLSFGIVDAYSCQNLHNNFVFDCLYKNVTLHVLVTNVNFKITESIQSSVLAYGDIYTKIPFSDGGLWEERALLA